MSTTPMTLAQFGATIKKKYPAYASKSDEEVGKAMLDKYPQYADKVQQPPQPKGLVDQLTEIQPHKMPHSAREVGQEVVKGVGNIGAGGLGVLLHPIDTARGMLAPVSAAIEAGRGNPIPMVQMATSMVQQAISNPFETAESMTGQAGALGGASELGARALPKVGDILKSPVETVRESIKNVTNTSPNDVAGMVKKASKANEIKTERATDINARRAEVDKGRIENVRHQNEGARAAHEAKIKEYEAAIAEGEEVKKAAQEVQTKRGQLARQVNEQSARLVERVRRVKAETKTKIDAAYQQIKKATAGKSVERTKLADAVASAESKLAGSNESIKVFRDILSKAPEEEPGSIAYQGANIAKGHPLYEVLSQMQKEGAPEIPPADFEQLQGYYSELGAQLAKGNLPGDVYQALKSLQKDIGGMMKDVAAQGKVEGKLAATQKLYHDYMESFNESSGPNHSGSPIASALEAKDPAYAIKPLTSEETAARIRNILARFDPSETGQGGAAQLFDNFRNVAREFNSLKEPKGVAKALTPPGEFVPKPEPSVRPPVKPKLKQFGESGLSAQKAENAIEAAHRMQKSKSPIVSSIVAFDMIRSGIMGNWQEVALDAAARILYSAGKRGIAQALEHPEIVARLSKLSDADYAAIAKLPPEQRTAFIGQMKPVIEAAQAKGIQIDPKLAGMVGAGVGAVTAPRRGVAAAMTPAGQQ